MARAGVARELPVCPYAVAAVFIWPLAAWALPGSRAGKDRMAGYSRMIVAAGSLADP